MADRDDFAVFNRNRAVFDDALVCGTTLWTDVGAGDAEVAGVAPETRDVRLEQGDLSEAWREGAREYATVAMRFSLVDVTRRVSDGAVVEGDPERRTEAVELWTFQRTQGGPWLLSAIQQTNKA